MSYYKLTAIYTVVLFSTSWIFYLNYIEKEIKKYNIRSMILNLHKEKFSREILPIQSLLQISRFFSVLFSPKPDPIISSWTSIEFFNHIFAAIHKFSFVWLLVSPTFHTHIQSSVTFLPIFELGLAHLELGDITYNVSDDGLMKLCIISMIHNWFVNVLQRKNIH